MERLAHFRMRTVFLGVIVVFGILPQIVAAFWQLQQARARLVMDNQSDADRVASVIAALVVDIPLVPESTEELAELARPFLEDKRALSISFYDAAGQVVQQNGAETKRRGNTIFLSREVQINGSPAGRVWVEWSTAGVDTWFASRARQTVFVLLFETLLLMGVFLFVFEQHVMIRLQKLREHIRQLPGRDHKQRFRWTGSDELTAIGHVLEDVRVEIAVLLEGNVPSLASEFAADMDSLRNVSIPPANIPPVSDPPTPVNEPVNVDPLATLEKKMRTHASAQIYLEAGRVFEPLAELVSDHAAQLNKQVEFSADIPSALVTAGEAALLVTIAEELVRNAVEHGVETTESRGAKASKASLKLSLVAKDQELVLEISDDGAGIDPLLMLKGAIDQGVISAAIASDLSDEDMTYLAFAEGVSAVKRAGKESPVRGHGLSLTKKEIEAVGGQLKVESEEGKGTKFIIKIPRVSTRRTNPVDHAA